MHCPEAANATDWLVGRELRKCLILRLDQDVTDSHRGYRVSVVNLLLNLKVKDVRQLSGEVVARGVEVERPPCVSGQSVSARSRL